MTNNPPTLLVAVQDQSAVVKINGRANFMTSVTFKRLITELEQRGFDHFILDLTECQTMDSTFLGTLAGTALEFGSTPPNREERPAARLRLLNPTQRVSELFDNLGIADLFHTVRFDTNPRSSQNLSPALESKPSREEVSRICLDAHKILMDVNPQNASRFKDVTQFLAEDLKKLRADAPSRKDPENGSTSLDSKG
jgi:anti-anti-sigma factor